ncbi:MAG: amidohydrolase [Phycisphaerales bacterium]|nr:amidohydrolase [Phycisphaerales bacterium]
MPIARALRCVAVGLLFVVSAGAGAEPFADLVMLNGRISTFDTHTGNVQALAVVGDRIATSGSNDDIRPWIGPDTKVIDLRLKYVMPGFIESHGHFVGLGRSKMELDLTTARRWDDIVALVAEAAKTAAPDEWIVGRGWHQEKWDERPTKTVLGFPTNDTLSAASPDHPVMLVHASGHAAMVNAKALELAGITQSTPDPDGGQIIRDDAGQPIGVLMETAQSLINAGRTPGASTDRRQALADTRRAIELATEECLRHGVTSFQDAGSSFFEIDMMADMARNDELGVRLWVMVREPNERLRRELPAAKHYRLGHDFFTVGGIKRAMDGALGNRGAWMLKPYTDAPETSGLAIADPADIAETAAIALEQGLQMCVHAIGDRANREVLDIYERLFKAHPEKTDLRWRIEHAQHLSPLDTPRFGELHVIASMQGIHCTSDGPWVIDRIGRERAEMGAYVWQKLIETNAIIINGTDTPVEPIDPIACIHASVTRQMPDGTFFFPGEAMTRAQALHSYTNLAAYGAFEDDIKGSISPNKLADLVVLSEDLLHCPTEQLRQARVLMTIVGGKIVYEATPSDLAPTSTSP